MTVGCRRPAARLFTCPLMPRFPLSSGQREAGALLAGRYRLVEVLGRGATARVWRARDEVLHRDVALKQFHQRRSQGLREARTAARVQHPNVVAVNDVLPSGDLVMEYRGAPTLATLLRDGRSLPPPVVATLGQQLLAALQAVHAARVVHCDVKPANMLVGDDGRLTLIDFGIAEIEGATPAHAARRINCVAGSPAYMAPSASAARPRFPRATSGRSARPSTSQSKVGSPSRRTTPSRASPRCFTTRRRRPGRPVASSRSWPGSWSRTPAGGPPTRPFTPSSPRSAPRRTAWPRPS